jgi:hypothetical protein
MACPKTQQQQQQQYEMNEGMHKLLIPNREATTRPTRMKPSAQINPELYAMK